MTLMTRDPAAMSCQVRDWESHSIQNDPSHPRHIRLRPVRTTTRSTARPVEIVRDGSVSLTILILATLMPSVCPEARHIQAKYTMVISSHTARTRRDHSPAASVTVHVSGPNSLATQVSWPVSGLLTMTKKISRMNINVPSARPAASRAQNEPYCGAYPYGAYGSG